MGEHGVPGMGEHEVPGMGDHGVPGMGEHGVPGMGDHGVPCRHGRAWSTWQAKESTGYMTWVGTEHLVG